MGTTQRDTKLLYRSVYRVPALKPRVGRRAVAWRRRVNRFTVLSDKSYSLSLARYLALLGEVGTRSCSWARC